MIYTLETAGHPVVAFSAENLLAAEDTSKAPWLRADLMVLVDADDAPLWDETSKLSVREATGEEKESWDKGVARGIDEGGLDTREDAITEGYIVFLVPVRDPTDDPEDGVIAVGGERKRTLKVVTELPLEDADDAEYVGTMQASADDLKDAAMICRGKALTAHKIRNKKLADELEAQAKQLFMLADLITEKGIACLADLDGVDGPV